jgi:acyl-CoA synthetase (AMP-forming)/AMP-acid ligase II
MPLPVVERAMTLLPHVNLVNAYGLTETSSSIAVLTPGDHLEAFASTDPAVRARLGSVGRALPDIELEVRGADGGAVGPGDPGEIHVRGPQVSGEYGTGSALTLEGWFPMNDRGYLDDEGFLFVEGRLDDVIVRGGEDMSPGEIEDVLLRHPAVAAVGVTGVPDDEWGEVVAAAVVVREGRSVEAPELRDWVRERLRSSRVSTVVDLRETLPYNDTGKLLRRVLRTELSGHVAVPGG